MRRAGILMPISALPSPYGIGTLGSAARDFVLFLQESGQSYWQLLPIGPTSYGDSPYQSFSSYAGNPYFIDLDDLAAEGLLLPEEYRSINWGKSPTSINYGVQYKNRYPVLRLAYRRFHEKRPPDFEGFCLENAAWLEDYALFMALKDKNGGVSWFDWPDNERFREPDTLASVRAELSDEIKFWQTVQYLFFKQWKALKAFANERAISIIGDLPIYVAGDSADIWALPEQFQLNASGFPVEVSGCPPDGYSPEGQIWGNPLFDWERMKESGYSWWISRIAFQLQVFDVLRIDHFRGFYSYFAIPFGDDTARNGSWRPGPGMDFFRTLNEAIGTRNIIVEDLGFLTPSVRKLLEETGYPGMKVLEFAFDSRDAAGSTYLPHNYIPNCVAYTGTHDNDTILGWTKNAPPADVDFAKRYLNLSRSEGYNWGMMRGAWSSTANLAVMQMQDVLGLGAKARMNVPSTIGKNWKWRALPEHFTSALARRLCQAMSDYGRLPVSRTE